MLDVFLRTIRAGLDAAASGLPQVRSTTGGKSPGVVPHYRRQLSERDVSRGEHREFVGGLWQEIGALQFDFLKTQGLLPAHDLLDVGCGCLRGGLHFIRYLEPERYCGLDANASLIKAASRIELVQARLGHKKPNLLVDDAFDFRRFGRTFDYALAVSLFTHLPVNSMERCLVNVAKVLKPGGRFFATFFESPSRHHEGTLSHPGAVVTHGDADPFHYHFSTFSFLVVGLPLSVKNLGDWGHPRGQRMLEFTRT